MTGVIIVDRDKAVSESDSEEDVEEEDEDEDLPDLSYLDEREYDENDEYDGGYCMDEFREAEYLQEIAEIRKGYEHEKAEEGVMHQQKGEEWTQEEHLRKLAELYPGDEGFTSKNLINVMEARSGKTKSKSSRKTKPVPMHTRKWRIGRNLF